MRFLRGKRRLQGRSRVWLGGVLGASLAGLAALAWATPAQANDTNIACGDTAGLVSAISQANLQVGGESHVILATGCTYQLTSLPAGESHNGLPTFLGSNGATLVIDGNGATISRSGSAPQFRFLTVEIGATAIINDVTFTGGYGVHAGTDSDAPDGGALLNKGTMTLNGVTLTGNSTGFGGNGSNTAGTEGNTGGAGGDGGGIANAGTLTVIGSTISSNITGGGGNGGDALANAGGGGSSGRGGGIYSVGPLTVQGSTVSFNTTGAGGSPGSSVFGGPSGSQGRGAGIYLQETAVITASLIRGNSTAGESAWGGAIAIEPNGAVRSLTLANTTIVDNTAYRGGALYVVNATAELSHVTMTGNNANGTGDFIGGDVAALENGGTVRFNSTIVFGNGEAGDDCDGQQFGGSSLFESRGALLADSATNCPANSFTSDPQLGALASNGGPTQTRLPAVGSPTINAGNAPRCSVIDQRGVSRPHGSNCDIGAVERATVPTIGVISGVTKTVSGVARPYTSNASGTAPLTYTWSVTGVAATITGGTGANPQITFNGVGDATIHLDVRSSNASASEAAQTTLGVHVGPADDEAPSLALTSPPSEVDEGSSLTFPFTTSDPEGDTISFAPNYPDCGTGGVVTASSVGATGGSVTCSYPNGLTLSEFELQLEDEYGEVSPVVSRTITVNDVAPVITISGDATPDEGQTPLYTYTIVDPGPDPLSTPTTDCVNTGGPGNIDKQAGSDTFTGTLYSFSGSLSCITPQGPETGAVTVTAGAVTATRNITVQNIAPSVVVAGPTTADETVPGVFYEYLYSASDPGVLDTPFGLVITASCGAGNTVVWADFDSITCVFSDGPSTALVSITVQDSAGATSTGGGVSVTVNNIPPTMTFFGPVSGPVNEGSFADYTFIVSDNAPESFTVTPPGGCVPIGSYIVQTDQIGGALRCTYADGPADIGHTLTVSDGTDSVSASLTQPVVDVAPTIAASLTPSTMFQGETATLVIGGITDPGQDTVTSWTVNWGDGETETFASNPGTITHQYNESDLFTVTIDLVDEDGTHLDASPGLLIQAYPTLPFVIFTSTPTSVDEGTTSTIEFTISDPSATATHSFFSASCGTDIFSGQPNTVSNATITGLTGQFDCSWATGDSTPLVQIVIANSEGEHSPPASFSPTVQNVGPTVAFEPSNPTTVAENTTIPSRFTFTVSDPGNDPLGLMSGYMSGSTIVPSPPCGSGMLVGSGGLATGTGWIDCIFPDGPTTTTLELAISDGDEVALTSLVVTIENAPPAVTIDPLLSPVQEGSQAQFTYTVTDPGIDSYAATPDCGGGTLDLSTPGAFYCTFPDGAQAEQVSILIDDLNAANNTGTAALNLNVLDVAPTIALGGANVHSPGVPYTLGLGAITDPGTDTVTTWVVHWGDGVTDTYFSASPNPTHTYATADPYTITVDLINEDGTFLAAGSKTTTEADITPPVVTVPSNIVVEADGPAGTIVTYFVSAVDDVDGPVGFTCPQTNLSLPYLPSGSTFPIGVSSLYCYALDSSANQTNSSVFTVTVEDTTEPTVDVPADITVGGTSAAGAVVTFSATASDTVDGALVPACTPASGSLFPRATTTVSCIATDLAGNEKTETFTITVTGTVTTADAFEEDLEVQIASNFGFAPGDYVIINPGGPDEEVRYIEGLGSLIFAAPLAHDHPSGTFITVIPPPLGDTLAPSISITTPSVSQQFVLGSTAAADFLCSDLGVGVQACRGLVADGAVLDTSSLGNHTFVVRAWDFNGNASLLSIPYQVVSAGGLASTGWNPATLVALSATLILIGGGLLALRYQPAPSARTRTRARNQRN